MRQWWRSDGLAGPDDRLSLLAQRRVGQLVDDVQLASALWWMRKRRGDYCVPGSARCRSVASIASLVEALDPEDEELLRDGLPALQARCGRSQNILAGAVVNIWA